MADLDDDELARELADFAQPEKKVGRPPREERIIAGFEEIQQFVTKNGHVPRHGEDRDIFERLYAVRLDRLRAQEECRAILAPLDHQGLLSRAPSAAAPADTLDDEALLAQLEGAAGPSAITELTHVRPSADRRAADEIANREKCPNFAQFKPLFEQVQADLDSGARKSHPFELKAEIRSGAWFIVGGQKAYIADMDEVFTNAQGRTDARLRVVFDNGTQSTMLMRSLQRALNKDEAGRRIADPVAGPLFSGEIAEADAESGTIYVLRSKSDHPMVAAHRELVHKIGVTGTDLAVRLAGARLQPTFLMADVEVVATYKLFNISRVKLEQLVHRLFGPAKLDIEIMDRFGRPIVPHEWFLVPLVAIDQAVERIKDGTIGAYVYDPAQAALVATAPDKCP